MDLSAADEASASLGLPVQREGIDTERFNDLVWKAYGTTAARWPKIWLEKQKRTTTNTIWMPSKRMTSTAWRNSQPSSTRVNLLLIEAIQSRTSDVHVEPFESELKIKYRIDGELVEQSPPPKHLQPALIGRIKIMSGMNIAERYVPQDGHITLRVEERKVDIRVSTVPTLYGESVVMRILDKSSLPLDLKSLGMAQDNRDTMDRMIAKPHGMVWSRDRLVLARPPRSTRVYRSCTTHAKKSSPSKIRSSTNSLGSTRCR